LHPVELPNEIVVSKEKESIEVFLTEGDEFQGSIKVVISSEVLKLIERMLLEISTDMMGEIDEVLEEMLMLL